MQKPLVTQRGSQHARRTASARQGFVEWLLLATVVIVALVAFAVPLQRVLGRMFAQGTQAVGSTADELMAALPPAPHPSTSDEPSDEDQAANDMADGWIGSAPLGGSAAAGSGSSGLGNSGGSGGGGIIGSGGGGGGTGQSSTPPPSMATPALSASEKINAAQQALLESSATFQLFDFVQNRLVTWKVADIIKLLKEHGIPILTGVIQAIAQVEAAVRTSDGAFDASQPVTMVFNAQWLATATVEMTAAVLAHEAWHVQQFFSGIHDDFVHYPRVVDIEYESFVVGAAVWNTVRGAQSEPSLNAGSSCVAQGEARCKEILATDFRYSTGDRRKEIMGG